MHMIVLYTFTGLPMKSIKDPLSITYYIVYMNRFEKIMVRLQGKMR